MKKKLVNQRLAPKQSDIVISPEGEVFHSFMWADINGNESTGSKSQLIYPKIQQDECNFDRQYKTCMMCPKLCGFDRLQSRHPTCGSIDIEISTWGLTVGDEKELVGSRGSGAILLAGCPLTCPSCHNPEMVEKGFVAELNDFIDICYKLLDQGAHNIQILSPTIHFAKLKVILTHLKKNNFPIPIVFKSSGVESKGWLNQFEGLVDVFVPDFKYGPCSQFAKRSGFEDYFNMAKKSINHMLKIVGPKKLEDGLLKKGVLVRHVMAPLPDEERKFIYDYLNSIEDQAVISITDNFVNLD